MKFILDFLFGRITAASTMDETTFNKAKEIKREQSFEPPVSGSKSVYPQNYNPNAHWDAMQESLYPERK